MQVARFLIPVVFALCALPVFSQEKAQDVPSIQRIRSEMAASWLVTVSGEERTRMLRVSTAKPGSTPETFVLDAVYGWTEGNLTPVKAEVVATAEKRTLLVTTQPGSKLLATLLSEGVFAGTFTPPEPGGQAKKLEVKKLSGKDLAQLIPSINSPADLALYRAQIAPNERESRKKASEAFLNRDKLMIGTEYKLSQENQMLATGAKWRNAYEAFPKQGYILFNVNSNICFNGRAKTEFSVDDDGFLVLNFVPNLHDCPGVKYVFHPMTGHGQIRVIDPITKAERVNSGARIWLEP